MTLNWPTDTYTKMVTTAELNSRAPTKEKFYDNNKGKSEKLKEIEFRIQ